MAPRGETGVPLAHLAPIARIIRYEIDDNVPSSRDHHCVLSGRTAIDGKVLWFCFPTALLGTVDIIAVYITVVISNKTSCAVILWICNVNNIKCVAMKMDWMGTVGSTNCVSTS